VSIDLKNLPDDIEELKRIIETQNVAFEMQSVALKEKEEKLEEQNTSLRNEKFKVKVLQEKVDLLTSRLFSKKSEKLGPIEEIQSILFNEIESLYDSEPELALDEETVTIETHTREGPVPVFLYRPDRSAKFLEDMLDGFTGSVITDGYASYNFLNSKKNIIHAGCNTHARRKFVEADKVSKNNPDTLKILNLYSKIYKIESDWKKLSHDLSELKKMRQEKSKPLMDELKLHLDKLSASVNPSGNLGKAVSYTRDEWCKLTNFLDHPEIPIDNNAVENGIRRFVIGRKNWLFADTPSGAHASALFFIR